MKQKTSLFGSRSIVIWIDEVILSHPCSQIIANSTPSTFVSVTSNFTDTHWYTDTNCVNGTPVPEQSTSPIKGCLEHTDIGREGHWTAFTRLSKGRREDPGDGFASKKSTVLQIRQNPRYLVPFLERFFVQRVAGCVFLDNFRFTYICISVFQWLPAQTLHSFAVSVDES